MGVPPHRSFRCGVAIYFGLLAYESGPRLGYGVQQKQELLKNNKKTPVFLEFIR
jgi:hypothetical protein